MIDRKEALSPTGERVDAPARPRQPIAHLFVPPKAQAALCGTSIGDREASYPARDGIEKCIVCLDLSHQLALELANERRQP